VRWWKAELIADDATVTESEFAVDPEAESEPVAELEMVMAVPSVEAREWWVVVTVETERGRMESGRVAVGVHPSNTR
jgi:hypothetical protein